MQSSPLLDLSPEKLLALRAELGPLDFANAAQERFFDSRSPELLYSGAMGAGKSRILCEKGWNVAIHHPGVTVGIFRKYAASLAPTTLRTFERDVVRFEHLADRNKSENWWQLRNGSRIYFLGLDPDPLTGVPSKVGSLDLAVALVDEAVELTEGDWIMLQGRLRDPRLDWHQLAAATNPGPPTHWLYKRFWPGPDKAPGTEVVTATASDNVLLPEDYRLRIEALPDNAWGRRLGRGLWVASEGTIYDLPPDQVRPPDGPHRRVVAGLDWGFLHATACEVVGQSGSGRVAVIDELYERGKTIDQLIPGLLFLQEQHGIEMIYADPSEPAYIQQCKVAGVRITQARNDVLPGVQSVQRAIRAGMSIDPACVGLLGEIPGYTWQPSRNGLVEQPVKVGDDACDALRYAIFSLEPSAGGWGAVTGSAGGVA